MSIFISPLGVFLALRGGKAVPVIPEIVEVNLAAHNEHARVFRNEAPGLIAFFRRCTIVARSTQEIGILSQANCGAKVCEACFRARV